MMADLPTLDEIEENLKHADEEDSDTTEGE